MNKIRTITWIVGVLLIYLVNSGCTSDANATSPCPSSFNSLEIRVFDSITGIEIITAEVIIAENMFNEITREYDQKEIIFNYNADVGSYGFQFSSDEVEIEKLNLTIYTLDSLYNSNVTKPQIFGCTSLESTIYLCPNGTACR